VGGPGCASRTLALPQFPPEATQCTPMCPATARLLERIFKVVELSDPAAKKVGEAHSDDEDGKKAGGEEAGDAEDDGDGGDDEEEEEDGD
jgi:hypothetical protein